MTLLLTSTVVHENNVVVTVKNPALYAGSCVTIFRRLYSTFCSGGKNLINGVRTI
jgi:hypothetical protein